MRVVLLGIFHQYIAGIAATLSELNCAACFMWTTPLLSYLQSPDSEIPMTTSELTWVVSIIELGNIISPFPMPFLMNTLGRKPMLLSTGPLFIVSWVLVFYFPSVWMLIVCRVVQGLVMGIVQTTGPIYLGEIASDSTRGAITSMFFNSWWIGIIISYTFGAYLSYRSFTILTMLLNLPFILLFFWQPETPHFYVTRGEHERALQSLRYFRDLSPRDLELELEEIKLSVKAVSENSSGLRDLFSTPWDRRVFVLVMVLNAARVITGTGGITVYATEIFNQSKATLVSPQNTTILFGLVMLLGSLFSSFTSDSLGRRPLLLISTIGSLVCQLVTGTYFFLLTNTQVDVSQFSWIAPLFIFLYSGLCTAGMYPVCTAYATELFSPRTRGVASSAGALVVATASFIAMVIFEPLATALGVYANFYIYAFNCFVTVLCVCFMAPETKGKSFTQIRNELIKSSSGHDSIDC